ncbi:MAG: HD domain-containing protein [Clostridiales bacterium]|nr:HD domain-containing protein [Clostridiales bacterium]
METILISEFEAGDRVVGFYIIKSINLKTSGNNKKYLDINLMDKSGEINAKIWGVDENSEKVYSAGSVLKIEGDITLWNNMMQLKIIRHRLANETDEIVLSDFVPSAPLKPEHMYEEIMAHIMVIEDEDIKKLVENIFSSYKEKLMYYPAAKSNHHSIHAGLLYHILRMLKTGEKLVGIYTVNKDLLYAGIILHDIEKINEMNSDEMGIVEDYTRDGQLLGHIIQGIIKIELVGRELGVDEEKYKLIQHMILSHHYEPEFGSPKKPMIPEGELLHYIDMIDARMFDMNKVMSTMDVGEFSQPVFLLDRRRLYKSKLYETE